MAAYHIHVGSRQSDGVDAERLQAGHELLVDQSAVDHGHHAQHVGIGDAPSVYHVAFYAEVGSHLCGTASAAVHQNFRSVDGREGLEQLGQALLILDDGASYFDDCDLFHDCRWDEWG